MGSKFSDFDEPIAEINIVPFVDIILVVLIIFMVTTPLIMKPSINVKLPKAVSGDKTTPTKLNIAVTAKGEILLNGKASSKEEISNYSKALVAKDPTVQAIISADKGLAYGLVMSVIDAVKAAGVKKFAMVTDKKEN